IFLISLCDHLQPSRADMVCLMLSYADDLHKARFPALSRFVLAVYSPTRQSPSSVYATTSRGLPNPAVDTAVDAAVRQQPNFAQLVADVALLRVVVPVLGAQDSPMPSAEVALVVAAFLARPRVLPLVRLP